MKHWIWALLLLADIALAGSATLDYTPPTQNEDGTPLTDLAGYKFYYGMTSGDYPNVVTVANPNISTYVIENLIEGRWYFVATSYNTAGVESRYSNEAVKDVPADPTVPNPPANLTVTDPEQVAYAIAKIYDDLMLLPVGTIPGGTPCKASSVNGKNVVDRQYVEWTSANTSFAVVVADCG